ncbi:hypothetical protein [Legionella bononiensis]|uniref:hypothetical protein n=1 Tax=Legionella bononiensis TaxID=2793102 RepID=UPI001933815B|nr:hypothetical protein [Legionella bononiensis]MBL7478781.1 hypothetical protein [Legionella bononiensis]MBL7562495.1 hypothetical protein [Legionella bononiensis]
MKSKIEDIFFYRSKQFQDQTKATWGMSLFTENTQTPQTFSTFWDNIHAIQSTKGKEEYANSQCAVLKNIKVKDMNIEFIPNKGLYISDKNDEDVFAVLDYRDSFNGELRGSTLKTVLEHYSTTNSNESVYDALNNILHSHHNPTFSGAVKLLKIGEQVQSIVFKAIDTVLGWVDKLQPAKAYSDEWTKNEQLVNEQFPKFLTELDKANLEQLQERLNSNEFLDEPYSSAREDAIRQLLTYRRTLFKETDTVGINLKDERKASKCHFSEQMINALVTTKPATGQSYKAYIETCIKKAEQQLTPEEVNDWPKGVFSHRLRDIVSEIKDKPAQSNEFRIQPE